MGGAGGGFRSGDLENSSNILVRRSASWSCSPAAREGGREGVLEGVVVNILVSLSHKHCKGDNCGLRASVLLHIMLLDKGHSTESQKNLCSPL